MLWIKTAYKLQCEISAQRLTSECWKSLLTVRCCYSNNCVAHFLLCASWVPSKSLCECSAKARENPKPESYIRPKKYTRPLPVSWSDVSYKKYPLTLSSSSSARFSRSPSLPSRSPALLRFSIMIILTSSTPCWACSSRLPPFCWRENKVLQRLRLRYFDQKVAGSSLTLWSLYGCSCSLVVSVLD